MEKFIIEEQAMKVNIPKEYLPLIKTSLYVKRNQGNLSTINKQQDKNKALFINKDDYSSFLTEIEGLGKNDSTIKVFAYLSCFKYQLLRYLNNPKDTEAFRETFSLVAKNLSMYKNAKYFQKYLNDLNNEKDLLSLILFRTMIIVLMAKKMNWISKNSISILVQSSFLCDANLLEINPNLHLKDPEDNKNSEFNEHIHTLVHLIKKFDIKDENIQRTILQHHECTDGTGPLKIRGSQIYPLAKVLRVADYFSRAVLGEERQTIENTLRSMKIKKHLLDSSFVYTLLDCFKYEEERRKF